AQVLETQGRIDDALVLREKELPQLARRANLDDGPSTRPTAIASANSTRPRAISPGPSPTTPGQARFTPTPSPTPPLTRPSRDHLPFMSRPPSTPAVPRSRRRRGAF